MLVLLNVKIVTWKIAGVLAMVTLGIFVHISDNLVDSPLVDPSRTEHTNKRYYSTISSPVQAPGLVRKKLDSRINQIKYARIRIFE